MTRLSHVATREDWDTTTKAAVITGGASGVGLATARRFAAEGARLHLGPTPG